MSEPTNQQSKKKLKWYWWVLIAIFGFAFLGKLLPEKSTEQKVEDGTVDKPITFVLNVNEIAGKKKEEVDKKLGKGTFEKNWKDKRAGCVSCPKYIYKNGQVEVIFIQDVADRITINDLGQYSYPSEALPAIGLENMESEFSNDMVTRWRSINGYREISAFNGQNNKVDYILVLTKAN